MPADDQTLLRRTHAGHEPSARELWSRHAGWMAAYARSVLGRRGDGLADDVVQSVFCRVLSLDRRAVRRVVEVRPWLARAVRHEALNHLRTLRRAALREASTAARSVALQTTADDPPDLAAAMAGLPRRQREVAYLRHVAGLTVEQTAAALGVPRGTVASRNHAAMQRLRDTLERSHPSRAEQPGHRDTARPLTHRHHPAAAEPAGASPHAHTR
ncbi:MAG: RNA polymerase sigma factor [Phycisphaerales bacterium JB041]